MKTAFITLLTGCILSSLAAFIDTAKAECEIELNISEPISEIRSLVGASPLNNEASKEIRNDLYFNFSERIEVKVIEMAKELLCKKNLEKITIDLEFLKLRLIEDVEVIDYIRKELIGTRNHYADIQINRDKRIVRVKIVWNPRRMLRDQLIIRGWKFDEERVLLPFTTTVVNEFYQTRKRTLASLAARLRGPQSPKSSRLSDEQFAHLRQLEFTELKGIVPGDLYGLNLASDKMMPRNPGADPFSGITRWLIRESLPGYLAATEGVLELSFDQRLTQEEIRLSHPRLIHAMKLYSNSSWVKDLPPIQ